MHDNATIPYTLCHMRSLCTVCTHVQVYMEPTAIGVQPLLKSWCDSLHKSLTDLKRPLQYYFDTLFEPCIHFLRKQVCIRTCMNIMCVWMCMCVCVCVCACSVSSLCPALITHSHARYSTYCHRCLRHTCPQRGLLRRRRWRWDTCTCTCASHTHTHTHTHSLTHSLCVHMHDVGRSHESLNTHRTRVHTRIDMECGCDM